MVILHGLMYILHYSSSLILMMYSEKRKQNYCLLLALTNSAPISDERMTLIPGAGRFEVTTSTGSSSSSGSSGSWVFVGGCSTVIRVKSVES